MGSPVGPRFRLIWGSTQTIDDGNGQFVPVVLNLSPRTSRAWQRRQGDALKHRLQKDELRCVNVGNAYLLIGKE